MHTRTQLNVLKSAGCIVQQNTQHKNHTALYPNANRREQFQK